ncbi:DUF3089 domain-containing protein [Saprospiraceae bacterium]|nr:DUF3089 domain-containing protein [Saprospiraceae bacterium]
MKYLTILLVMIFLASCAVKPKGVFTDYPANETPDYSLKQHWMCLPEIDDNSDRAPAGLSSVDSNAPADVFYLHPTNYFGDKEFTRWNAEIDNEKVNKWNDENSALYQASAWNSAGKVYAPRYRQAHIQAYYAKDKMTGKKALDQAYEDIKEAFSYYMSHYNKGRPFIIASHSQGTTHATRLIQEFIDNKPLEKRMIAAYLIGIPVDLDKFESLKACQTKDDTNCLIGWRTFKTGHEPRSLAKEVGYNVLITNPLTWKTTTELAPASMNRGMVLFDFDEIITEGVSNAQIHKGILWVSKPKFKGSALYVKKNYHRGDINLFYMNIRENAANRVGVFHNNM